MKRPGTYVLVFVLPKPFDGSIGALGLQHLEPGHYAYVGSARGGLDQRLSRHFLSQKTMRWHIDRLTVHAQQLKAYEFRDGKISECELAYRLMNNDAVPMLKGFGCSDCRCSTHLFSIGNQCREYLQYFCDSIYENKEVIR